MLTITSSATMAHALDALGDVRLKRILQQRVAQLVEHDGYDLGELAHFHVVDPADDLATIETALGFPVVIDGTPCWEWVLQHGSWFEAVFILSDDGFGWVLLVPDHTGVDCRLLSLCRRHAMPV